MRKFHFMLAVAAVVLSSFVFVSCSKSPDAILDETASLTTELKENLAKRDTIKVIDLAVKINELTKDIDCKKLSEEQKAKYDAIRMECDSIEPEIAKYLPQVNITD